MSKFKVGDKVRLKKGLVSGKDYGQSCECGECLFVESMRFSGVKTIESSFSKYWLISGQPGYFTYSDDMFEPAEDLHKIVITSDGKTTTAKLYNGKKVEKTASTVCSEKDEYDFTAGAKIAMDRLTAQEPPKPKYYNGKVFCVETTSNLAYTKGKIYEVVEGQMIIDNGHVIPVGRRAISFKDLAANCFATIQEVVE